MTDTQEAMREEFDSLMRTALYYRELDCDYIGDSTVKTAVVLAMYEAATQSAEKIAKLEEYIKQLEAVSVTEEELSKACEDYLFKAAAAELSNRQLKEKISDAQCELITDEGAGAAVRILSDALAQQLSTEALDAYVAKLTKWQPIETAPKDGTYIWLSDGLDSCSGKYVEWKDFWTQKSCKGWAVNWNSEFNCPDKTISATYWIPLPPAPDKE